MTFRLAWFLESSQVAADLRKKLKRDAERE
jgi:hypothetical protein